MALPELVGSLEAIRLVIREERSYMEWIPEFDWQYSPFPDDKIAIEENITATINNQFDDLPASHEGPLRVTLYLSGSDRNEDLPRLQGKIHSHCGRLLLKVEKLTDSKGSLSLQYQRMY